MTNNATRAANAATFTERPISVSNPSSRARGSGTGSGHKGLGGCSSLSKRSLDAEVLTYRDRWASGVAGCSDHLGAYLLSSESVPSSREALMITLLRAASDRIYLLTDDVKVQDNLKYDQKMTAAGQIRKHTLPLSSTPTTLPKICGRKLSFGSTSRYKRTLLVGRTVHG
jgi:hypothetical protein